MVWTWNAKCDKSKSHNFEWEKVTLKKTEWKRKEKKHFSRTIDKLQVDEKVRVTMNREEVLYIASRV